MSRIMAGESSSLEAQLLSIMDVLVKAAALEISQLFSENSSSLRLHLSQSLRENESLRTRMKGMRSELFTLRLQTRINRPAGRMTPIRTNTPKTRIRPNGINDSHMSLLNDVYRPLLEAAVVNKPAPVKKPAAVSARSFLPPETKTTSTSPVKQEPADVILINDEDDIGRCAPIEADLCVPGAPSGLYEVKLEDENDFHAHGSQNDDDGAGAAVRTSSRALAGSSDHLADSAAELRIVSVCGGDGTAEDEGNVFYTPSDMLGSMGSMGSDDRFLSFADPNPGMQEATRNSHRNLSDHMMKAFAGMEGQGGQGGQGGQPSLQSKSLDLLGHRSSHPGEQPVTCPMCGKAFVNKTTLTIHMRIHTGEKPYACGQCGKRFTQNGSLKIHLRTHSGEKPYSCMQCQSSFNNPSNLRRHMITHSTDALLGP